MIFTVLWLLSDMLYLKTDVNVPTVRNKQSKLGDSFFVSILKATT